MKERVSGASSRQGRTAGRLRAAAERCPPKFIPEPVSEGLLHADGRNTRILALKGFK
ncbi:hypothetical protein [Paenibacillus sp. SAFN-054]|uniref:hypothetical protein n=1 Tax=Paenibacillus sp. SAFN-054 TaxID=3436865 RepID=UPI003F7D6D55